MAARLLRRPGRLVLGAAAPWWRRSPGRVGRWVLALGLAVVAAALFGQLARSTGATVDDWGATRSVMVARRDLEAGHVIETGDVSRETLPAAALPASAQADD